jgi:Zn-dependent alcohol dehydrogenase
LLTLVRLRVGTCTNNEEQFIPKLIELHKQGKFPVDKISRVYPVAELKKAISDMKNGTVRTGFY